jgi:phenol hydroxylase P0 protein
MTEDAALTQQKYVRVIERREDGFVEFRFSIGYPEYYAELVLSGQDFEVFCKENAVTFLPEGESAGSDDEPNGLTWSLRDVAKGRMPR